MYLLQKTCLLWVWAPTSYPYKWVTGVITLPIYTRVLASFATGRGPPCRLNFRGLKVGPNRRLGILQMVVTCKGSVPKNAWKIQALRIMGSQNWWLGDPRTLLYRFKSFYRRVQWFLGGLGIGVWFAQSLAEMIVNIRWHSPGLPKSSSHTLWGCDLEPLKVFSGGVWPRIQLWRESEPL